MEFRQTVIALTSLMNAVALMELAGLRALREFALELEVIGWEDFDEETQDTVRQSEQKVALVFFWLQSLVAQAVDDGVLNVPPPLLSRSFAELGSGMVHFENACKLTDAPFPLYYTQATIWLLVMHWVLTPLTVLTWTHRPSLAFCFSFLMVAAFWSLFFISELLEEPFGEDDTDIDVASLQQHSNERLTLLLSPEASRLARFKEGRSGGGGEMAVRPADILSSRTAEVDCLSEVSIEACCCLVAGQEELTTHRAMTRRQSQRVP
mmetsp:Transcript_97157/g.299451  ORF Transcript_97157/g.299451 Transcript_97157/m.299451 type:complete len:265 (+) Transcript_97157:349-1143(+)